MASAILLAVVLALAGPGAPPPIAELSPLPGGGVGGPVVTSNNPEVFQGDGLLYGTAGASARRGGTALPLGGDFGVYLHHLNRSGAPRYLTVLLTNPGPLPAVIRARGSVYTQTETGGLGLGRSPDHRVSREWIEDQPGAVLPPAVVPPRGALSLVTRPVAVGVEIDGRLAISASAPVFTQVVASYAADLDAVLRAASIDAPGIIAVAGRPAPPFGREAGVYAHDTWRGAIAVEVPRAGGRVGFLVNGPAQAFPALTRYADSSAESVGMYGNVYDLRIDLLTPPAARDVRRVRVWFASLGGGHPSRYWDGAALVDGRMVIVQHTPTARTTLLADVSVPPGARRAISIRAMVPGLTAIPQALYLESY